MSMVKFVRQFAKDSTIYALEPILTKGITFVLIPLYTAYITPSDFGNLQLILTIGAFFTAVIDLGLKSSFWKFRSDAVQKDKGEVTLNMLVAQSVVGFLLFFGAGMVYLVVMGERSVFYILLLIYCLSVIIRNIFEVSLLIYRANFESKKYVVMAIIQAALLAGLNVVFVKYARLDYKGVIYGYVVTAGLTGLSYFLNLRKDVSGKINPRLLKGMVSYGVPIMLGNVAAIVISLSDRFFLKAFSTSQELGLYSFGYKFADLVYVLLVNSFFLAWNPIRWDIYKMEGGKDIFAKFYRIFFCLLPVAALAMMGGVLLAVPLITVNKAYLEGLRIIILIGFGHVFHAVYYFNAMGMLFTNRTKVIMFIIMISGGVNIVLNFALIPRWGMLGAGIATIGSYFVMFLMGRFYGQKFYPIRRKGLFEISQIILIVLSTVFLTIVLYHRSVVVSGVAVLACAGLYIAINFGLGYLRIGSIMSLLRMLRNKSA
ncbi:MAG: oligosaccharide flippase family protein [Candidatus Aminicenantales bacterium]